MASIAGIALAKNASRVIAEEDDEAEAGVAEAKDGDGDDDDDDDDDEGDEDDEEEEAEEGEEEEEAPPPEPRPHTDPGRDDDDKWFRYNEALISLSQGDYEGAASILEPLTEEDEGPFSEDPDALFHMAAISIWRSKRADAKAEDRGLQAPSAAALSERRRTVHARRDENVVGDALASLGAARAGPSDGPPDRGAAAGAPAPAPGGWDTYESARSAQKKFRGLLAEAGGRRRQLERMSGLRATERYLERAKLACEEHATMDDFDEVAKKINLELLALAMDSDDTRTARAIAESGDLDLEPECRLVLAELLLKSGQEKSAARQTVLAVRRNTENRATMRQTISRRPSVARRPSAAGGGAARRGTNMYVRRESAATHAHGLRAAVRDLEDGDDACADLDWAFSKEMAPTLPGATAPRKDAAKARPR